MELTLALVMRQIIVASLISLALSVSCTCIIVGITILLRKRDK